jgi:tetratricopeptide (TPR) repeat protein
LRLCARWRPPSWATCRWRCTWPSCAPTRCWSTSRFYAQGDYAAARPLYERALHIHEQTLGPNHPDTANSLWWLGTLLDRDGDHAGARERLRRAAAIFARALGEAHPRTQNCRRQLAAMEERG